jgi:hypothetical protein
MRSQFANSPHEGKKKEKRKKEGIKLVISLNFGLQGSLIPSFGFDLPGLLVLFH